MRKSMFQSVIVAAFAAVAFGVASQASAVNVTGWWRMEQDNDAGSGYSIANEVAGSALVGDNGSVETLSGGGISLSPINDDSSFIANNQGLNGSPNINGTIAQYAALDSSSITVEFFARSNEGDARWLLRQSGSTGLRIDQPNDIRVQYSTSEGQVTLDSNFNMNANWNHVAFTYDEASGLGQVFIDGVLADSNDGTDGLALTWPNLDLSVGNGVDGGSGFSGNSEALFDELRILDGALNPSQFLIGDAKYTVPEPTTATLALLGLAGLAKRRRRVA